MAFRLKIVDGHVNLAGGQLVDSNRPKKVSQRKHEVPVEGVAWRDKLELNPIDGRST
jgi:hypothetical protein